MMSSSESSESGHLVSENIVRAGRYMVRGFRGE